MSQNLIIEKKDKVTIVTLNRPEALNALNSSVLNDLDNYFKQVAEDRSVRVIILTGNGEKAFVAGADLKEINTLDAPAAQEFAKKGQNVFSRIESLPQVVIGAINGFALGGGLELALSCDFLIASPRAKFGLPEVGLGLLPGFGGTQRLSRLVGLNKARELIFSGQHIDAQEALSIGLINKVSDNLIDTALESANKILKNGPLAIAHAKKSINSGFDLTLTDGLKIEAQEFSNLFKTPEHKEGIGAFLEKRKPNFS